MAAATFVDDSGPTAKRVRLCSKTPPAFVSIFGELGCEDKAARQQVYLATVARVLPGTRASSEYRDVAKLARAQLLSCSARAREANTVFPTVAESIKFEH